MFKSNGNERGQAIIVLAMSMVVLLLMGALAIDGGNMYVQKRQAQNASDAGAMAGARQVVFECAKQGLNPGPNEANIRNQITRLVTANKPGATAQVYYVDSTGARVSQNEVGTLGMVPCSCTGRATGVEVVVNSTTPTFMAGLIGLKTFDVQTTARARYGAVSQPSAGLYPFTRRNMAFTYNQEVTLRVLDDADAMPGNFGWLTWDGSNNAAALVQALTPPGTSKLYYNPGTPDNNWAANHDDHVIKPGKWMQGAPGNQNASGVRAQLDWFISTQTPLTIPLYDAVDGNGSHSNYRVASFAAFVLKSYDFTGNDKSMTGKFIKWVTNGDWSQGVTCQQETGLYSIKLTP